MDVIKIHCVDSDRSVLFLGDALNSKAFSLSLST